jgi:hypothetical protein
MWSVPVRFLVMWSPIVAVSIGGGVYLAECSQVLLSPGTGFKMDYPAKDGTLKIECKTYSFDPFQHTLVVERLMIHKSDGSLLARIPHLLVTGIVADEGFAPKLQLKDAELWVTRNAKGELDILNLFVKQESTSSQQPWQVSVRDSVLHFNDLSVKGGAKNDVELATGNFVGMGNNVEGGATATIPGLISGQIGFKKSESSTTVFGKQVTGRLAPILARLRAGLENKIVKPISRLRLASGEGKGDFSIILANNKPRFTSNLTLKVISPQWNEYRADSVDFVGSISERGLKGKAIIHDKKLVGDVEGALSYGKKTVFAGNVKVVGLTPTYLKIAKIKLPRDVAFTESSSQGYLTYNDGKLGWKGRTTVSAANIYGLKLLKVDGDVTLQGDQLLATLRPTKVGATMIEGNFGLNLRSKVVLGSFSTPQVNASDFSKWLPSNVLDSKARLVGLIDGTLSKPNVIVKGTLNPKIKLADRTLAFSPADVVLRFDGNQFSLDRLTLTDEAGSLYASGNIDLKKGINVKVVGNNINLAKLAANTSGKLDVQGLVTGKLSDPRYVGKVQGYQIGYSGVPGTIVAVASDFTGNNKGINFSEVDAMKGASQITGSLGIGFADKKLAGMFAVNGIDVSDLYDGPVVGILDLKDVTVAGTLAKPNISGSFDAKKVLAYNFAVDSAKGKLSYDGEQFKISEASAQLANGSITDIAGNLVAKTKTGNVAGRFQKLDLTDISQTLIHNVAAKSGDPKSLSSSLAIKGATSGSFSFSVSDGTFASLKSRGRVDDVFLNKATIGSGEWDVAFDGTNWTGDAFIGSLAEYFRIDNALYRPTTGEIGGEFLSYQIPVKELIVAAEPSMKANLGPEAIAIIEKIDGKLGGLAQFSGTASKPTVDISEFEVSAIKLGKEDIGSFSMKAKYGDGMLALSDGLLVGPKQNKVVLPFVGRVTLPDNLAIPDGTAKLAGNIRDFDPTDLTKGQFDIKASIYGFPISKFEPLLPSNLSGSSALNSLDLFVDTASFNLSGSPEKPNLASHLEVSAGLAPDGKNARTGLMAKKLKLATDVSVVPDVNGEKHVTSAGTFRFDTIEGSLDSNFFLNKDYAMENSKPISVAAKLTGDRDISSFFKQTSSITLGPKGAHLNGGLEYLQESNKPVSFKGGFNFDVDSLKVSTVQPMIGKPIDTILKNLSLSATIEHDPKAGYVLRTQGSTSTNYAKHDDKVPDEGLVKIDAKIPIPEVENHNFDNLDLANRPILDGSLAFTNFALYQTFLQNTFAQATVNTETGKPVLLAGTLTHPKISGSIFFDDVKTVIPTLQPTTGTPESSSIDPTFDLNFFANSPMSIKSSLASIDVIGAGSLKGTLSNLKVDGSLTVQDGDLLLPGGKVKLSPDGTLVLKYDGSAFNSHATLDANLHGETSLTVLKNGLTPERYDISLDVKGDLLAPDALSSNDQFQQGNFTRKDLFTATSIPGDLDQTRILQLLGRYDLLQSVIQSGVNSNVRDELKNAGLGFALPSLFSGITNELAKTFKLDYVGVDYNAFEQTSISFVKNLGKGFFIQGRQQLLQPLPGQPTAYDFRLAYRPRKGPNAVRALSFSLGTDQLRPYKFSIDYTGRIRTTKPSFKTIHLFGDGKSIIPIKQ